VIVLTLLVSACGRDPDTLVRDGYDEAEMDAAIAKARAGVGTFLESFAKGEPGQYAVKAMITDGEEHEHFWLSDIAVQDGVVTGTIDNEPGIVTNVKIGQKWSVKAAEISDWMIIRDGRIHGNHTLRPLLRTMSEEEAAMWRSRFAEP
jgi:uncharacterized protein YegJ (DUF2314 family)